VEREANNPLRMIIEASKIKPKAKPAEPARPPERAAPVVPSRPLASASAPAELARVEAPGDKVESAVATVEVDGPAERAIAPPPPVVAEPSPAASLAPLQLADIVEPSLPRSLIGKLRGEILVVVGFTVRADGTVAEPVIRSTSHPQMDEAVLEAVKQWRYQPIAAPRAHEVQLVLRPAG
jgi:protein TonB